MTEEEARQAATSLLSQHFAEFATGRWVVSGVEEHDGAWAFFYNTRGYVQTRDPRQALAGNSALVIPKDGQEPWFAWAGADLTDQIALGRSALADDVPHSVDSLAQDDPGADR
ncbi:MAG: YrhB domain-containing protein [Kineosporiaceae bacterium]